MKTRILHHGREVATSTAGTLAGIEAAILRAVTSPIGRASLVVCVTRRGDYEVRGATTGALVVDGITLEVLP